jgi:hypothetical protein
MLWDRIPEELDWNISHDIGYPDLFIVFLSPSRKMLG